jgi:hypothetical protein
MTMDDFNVGVTLGTGSFGRVRFAVEKVSYSFLQLVIRKKINNDGVNLDILFSYQKLSSFLLLLLAHYC